MKFQRARAPEVVKEEPSLPPPKKPLQNIIEATKELDRDVAQSRRLYGQHPGYGHLIGSGISADAFNAKKAVHMPLGFEPHAFAPGVSGPMRTRAQLHFRGNRLELSEERSWFVVEDVLVGMRSCFARFDSIPGECFRPVSPDKDFLNELRAILAGHGGTVPEIDALVQAWESKTALTMPVTVPGQDITIRVRNISQAAHTLGACIWGVGIE